LAGAMLHVTWNLDEVFKNDKLGDYDDIIHMGLKILLDGMALGEAAKQCFSRSVFVAGGSSTNWNARKEFDWRVSCARLGLMLAGRIVRIGECLYDALSDHKKVGDEWHFLKKEPYDAGSAASAFARDIARDCLMAQKVQSGAHFYQQHECVTAMGPCIIAAIAAGVPLETGDAYGVGIAAAAKSPPRRPDARNVWQPTDWTESDFPIAQNFAHAPLGIPWMKIPWVRCDPGSLTVRQSPSHHDMSPCWLLVAGLTKRLDSSIVIVETVIMAGEGQNQERRAAQQSLWITNQEINYGFSAMAMQAFRLANESRPWHRDQIACDVARIGGSDNTIRS
jgi:hypothetical protein